jgi:hypothetical protein
VNLLTALLLLIPPEGGRGESLRVGIGDWGFGVLHQEAIDLAQYRARLRGIQEAVDRRDLDAVTSGARDLLKQRVQHDGMVLVPDATVLAPLAEAKTADAARDAGRRLKSLRDELEAIDGGPPPPAPDGALLEKLRQEEQLRQLSPDRSVGGPGLHGREIPRSWLDRLAEFGEWCEKLLQRFLRWLGRLFFGAAKANQEMPSTRYLVIGLVALLLGILAIVAFIALRRRRESPAAVATSKAPAMSAQDADPLSRTANEWERFAAELMKSGRFREAIRAWYHAILVSLFRAGTLHYRKDRTNWEYAYALPSTVTWRSGFMDATRTFEQEWYGRRDTAVDTAERYQESAIRMLDTVRGGGER